MRLYQLALSSKRATAPMAASLLPAPTQRLASSQSLAGTLNSPPLVSFTRSPLSRRMVAVKASSAPSPVSDKLSGASKIKSGTWAWKFEDKSVSIHYEEHEGDGSANDAKILLLPSISDTSTVEEWRSVANQIIAGNNKPNYCATIVDWPGLGFSDRPKMDYNSDVMEKFLVQFIQSPDSPFASSGDAFVIFGAGHAATVAIRAASKQLINPLAIAAVAPTWSGPLPIVFGRSPEMESRYGILRGTLKAPAVGWMMYNMLLSNEKAIRSQFESHVYADPRSVTPDLVRSRYELTKRKGARYVPAAFLTGLLDPVGSREDFLSLFSGLDGRIPVMVVSGAGGPKRSKAEMEALRGAKGVSKFVEVPGALLPHEEYPAVVAKELHGFLEEQFIFRS